MSHTTHIKINMTDAECIAKACDRLGYKFYENDTVKFYDGREIEGIKIGIPGVRHPIVISNGEAYFDSDARYDKYEIGRISMFYGVEKTKKMAKRKGYRCKETVNPTTGKPQVKIYVTV